MKCIFLIGPIVALTTSCTTLDQSFRLGAVTGALTGAAATYAAHGANGRNPSPEEVGLGASIGLGLGLITSYFVHQQVIEDRDEMAKQTEIYFGDLPPSPFVIPQPKLKKVWCLRNSFRFGFSGRMTFDYVRPIVIAKKPISSRRKLSVYWLTDAVKL